MAPTHPSQPGLSEVQGRALVALARKTLLAHFGRSPSGLQDRPLERQLEDPVLGQRCGNFVTLKKKGQLRGCIGSLSGREPLVEGVRANALNAAFHDPRFDPLGDGELDDISIEVSVLTEPRPLEYRDGDELMTKLRPGVDGVLIRKHYNGATFLPQVWDQLPKAQDFLSHLCMKAGLPANAWKDGDLEVETYQVQYFEETG
jgi:AmmeMemoRadiSam system protein A